MTAVLVVATLAPRDETEVARAAGAPCDLVEVRLDTPARHHIAATLALVGRPAIASCRRKADGGVEDLDEGAREGALRDALDHGVAFVDVEHDAPFRDSMVADARRRGVHVIVSHHDMSTTPDPDACLTLLGQCGRDADVVKLATRVKDTDDVATLLEVARRAPTLGVPFAVMGVGDATLRAVAGPLGMALVYAAPGARPVPGQLPARVQDALPKRPAPARGALDLVLVGHPLAHSLSPCMQEAALAHLGLAGAYRLVDAPADRLDAVLTGLAAQRVTGGNVTSPHKGRVRDACATLTPQAEVARAINTFVVRDDGTLTGHTTDGLGVVDALRARGERLDGRRVLVVGAGGTARAAVHALLDAGAEPLVSNRTAAKADALARDAGVPTVAFERSALEDAMRPGAVLLNATPAELPVGTDVLARGTTFDVTYGPDAAPLAVRAARAGGAALDGLDLLVHQGRHALAFWLDRPIPHEVAGVMSCAARTGALERRYGRRSV